MPDPYYMPTDDELRTSGAQVTVGLLHPGEMGSAIGASTVEAGARVIWVSEDRSAATRARAEAASLLAGCMANIVMTKRCTSTISA